MQGPTAALCNTGSPAKRIEIVTQRAADTTTEPLQPSTKRQTNQKLEHIPALSFRVVDFSLKSEDVRRPTRVHQ